LAEPQYSQPYGAPAVEIVYRRSFLGDVAAGALYGDFAQNLRVPGALTQIVLSFIPLVGTLCAVRDLVADMRHRDRVGIVLNFFALAPVLGGFSKTLEVLRAFAHVGHAYVITRRQRIQRRERRRSAAVSA
jgi:hypothetical protein